MAGCPCRGQQARGSPPVRGDPEPGRARAERLVAGTWRRASAYRPGCATAEARERSGQVAQREGPALAAAVARLGSSPGGPRLARVRPGAPGPRWPYPASLIANPRYGPSGINFRLRFRNAVSVTRNEFRPPLRIRRPGGCSSRAGQPAGITPDRRPPARGEPVVARAARARAAAPGGRTRPAAENPITNCYRTDNRTCEKGA